MGILRTFLALLAAVMIFAVVVAAALFIIPYVFGVLTHCLPPSGSCGDGVGWAMLISSPISVPIILSAATVLAVMTYVRVKG